MRVKKTDACKQEQVYTRKKGRAIEGELRARRELDRELNAGRSTGTKTGRERENEDLREGRERKGRLER